MNETRYLTEQALNYVGSDPVMLAIAMCSDEPLGWLVTNYSTVFVRPLTAPNANQLYPAFSLDIVTLAKLGLYALPERLPPSYTELPSGALYNESGLTVYRSWPEVIQSAVCARRKSRPRPWPPGSWHRPTMEFLFGGRFDGGSANSTHLAVSEGGAGEVIVRAVTTIIGGRNEC